MQREAEPRRDQKEEILGLAEISGGGESGEEESERVRRLVGARRRVLHAFLLDVAAFLDPEQWDWKLNVGERLQGARWVPKLSAKCEAHLADGLFHPGREGEVDRDRAVGDGLNSHLLELQGQMLCDDARATAPRC